MTSSSAICLPRKQVGFFARVLKVAICALRALRMSGRTGTALSASDRLSARSLIRTHIVLSTGADPIEDRPGFAALLDRIENNGVRIVIVEDVSRFAREMKAYVQS